MDDEEEEEGLMGAGARREQEVATLPRQGAPLIRAMFIISIQHKNTIFTPIMGFSQRKSINV